MQSHEDCQIQIVNQDVQARAVSHRPGHNHATTMADGVGKDGAPANPLLVLPVNLGIAHPV
jgi:hypothetical protein